MAPSSQVFRVTRDGKVTPFAQLPQIPPGQGFDDRGDIYVAANFVNKLVKVGKDKKVTVLEAGGLMDFPASLAFGVGKDSKTLYVTNFGLLTAQGGGKPKVGVLKREMGVRGRSLP
jgi:hypothetical protein